MNSKLLFAVAFAAIACVGLQSCGSAKSSEPKVLKFNLQKGKSYAYSMDMDMDIEAGGVNAESEINADYQMAVTDDAGGVKTVEAVYKRMAMKMDGGGQSINVDSDKAADSTAGAGANPMNMVGNMFRAMVGKKFTMKVDAEGNVTSVEGINELKEAVLSSMGTDPQMRPAMEQAFSQQFNENALKESFRQAFSIFPNKAVKVGDSWEKEMKMPGAMQGNMRTKYTVKDMTDKKVTLDATSDIAAGPMQIKQTGTLEVDAATGLVLNGELKQTGTGQGKLSSTVKIEGKEL